MKLAAEKVIAAKIAAARAQLSDPVVRPANPAATLGAAALAATAAVIMAGVVVVGPGVRLDAAVTTHYQP